MGTTPFPIPSPQAPHNGGRHRPVSQGERPDRFLSEVNAIPPACVQQPLHVAEQMPDEKTTIVALLHDVVEDTSYSLRDIREMGFESDIVDALARLTHGKNVSYMDYAANIKENSMARTVKLADLRHNSDLTRLDEINEEALSRVEKYKAAIQLLSED